MSLDPAYLSEILLSDNVVSSEQLEEAVLRAEKGKISLLQVLVETGYAAKEEIYTVIADNIGVPFIDVSSYVIDPEVSKLVPKEMASEHLICPLFKIEGTLTVAMADPTDFMLLDRVRAKSCCEVEACLAPEDDLKQAIEQSYGGGTAYGTNTMGKLEGIRITEDEGVASITEETPVSKLVELIITQAVRDRASDIHVEPEEDILRIRFRIDGILYEIPSPPKSLELAIISRIKVMANLDIATSRIPQDGHFKRMIDAKEVDARVSTIPTIYGENVVVRLLSSSASLIGMDELGLSPLALGQFEEMISHPWGTILATGPTGSGKTTTLYAALSRVNTVEKNIITIEDPVETRLPYIRQIQVSARAGLTFATGLRSIVRQDPDIIMVGEIRDIETAEISIQAALTGHLVFSTLHTNDAAGAITRLVEMGVEPFLISGSITGVIAQRLVRRICLKCKESYKPSKALVERLRLDSKKEYRFYRGRGCGSCKGTGYKDRVAIFELLRISDEMRELIIERVSSAMVKRKALEQGMKELKEDGLSKVLQGITTIEEVARVTEMGVDIRAPVQFPKEEVEPEEEKKKILMEEKSFAVGGSLNLEEYRKKITSWIAKK